MAEPNLTPFNMSIPESDTAPLRILDHALVRYMERVKGLNLDLYRQEIRALAGSGTPIAAGKESDDGAILIITDDGNPVVVSVLGPGQRTKRRSPKVKLVHIPTDLSLPNILDVEQIAQHIAEQWCHTPDDFYEAKAAIAAVLQAERDIADKLRRQLYEIALVLNATQESKED